MGFPFPFLFFLFFSFFFFVFRSILSFSVFPFLFSFFRSFYPFVLSCSVCFSYRLLRSSFCFPAFLGGGFCYSVTSSRRYIPPAILARLKYMRILLCVLSSCVPDVVFSCFFFSSFPFSISIWTSFVSSCLFLVGTVLSPWFRFLLRLVWLMI